jgi:hypothetical protein
MSSDDGNHVVVIKVEEVADIKAEEDPDPPTSPFVKTEPAVSCLCMCVCVYPVLFTLHIYPELFNLKLPQ